MRYLALQHKTIYYFDYNLNFLIFVISAFKLTNIRWATGDNLNRIKKNYILLSFDRCLYFLHPIRHSGGEWNTTSHIWVIYWNIQEDAENGLFFFLFYRNVNSWSVITSSRKVFPSPMKCIVLWKRPDHLKRVKPRMFCRILRFPLTDTSKCTEKYIDGKTAIIVYSFLYSSENGHQHFVVFIRHTKEPCVARKSRRETTQIK